MSKTKLQLDNPDYIEQYATITPTAWKVPQADGSGKLDDGWLNKTQLNGDFVAGENITAGNTVIVASGNGSTNTQSYDTSSGSALLIYGTNWGAQIFTAGVDDLYINSVTLKLKRGITSNSDVMTVSIRATDGTNPTGSDLVSVTFLRSSLTTSLVNYTYTFSTPVRISGGAKYAIVLSNPSGTFGAEEIQWGMDTGSSSFAGGYASRSIDGGNSWTELPDSDFSFAVELQQLTGGRVYKTCAIYDNQLANNTIGIAQSSVTTGQSVNIVFGGIDTTNNSLTVGKTYFLSDTPGAIGTSPGSRSRKIGIAVSDTELLIKHDNH